MTTRTDSKKGEGFERVTAWRVEDVRQWLDAQAVR